MEPRKSSRKRKSNTLLRDFVNNEGNPAWKHSSRSRDMRTCKSRIDLYERPKPGGEHTEGRDINISEGKERNNLPFGRTDLNDDSWMHQSNSDDEISTDTSSDDGRKGWFKFIGKCI
ncbi:hypothetical protein RJT34_02141 [Clitoria ternatea]|uniref:Uncharacterized protein n=1 Tax=Clitoria ternatea TaxID=43366 RepID=A0AAN9KIS8_CLITE